MKKLSLMDRGFQQVQSMLESPTVKSPKHRELIQEILTLSKKDPSFNANLSEYGDYLKGKDLDDLVAIRNRKRVYLNPAAIDREVEQELNKMDKAGMFNIGNLSPEHALD